MDPSQIRKIKFIGCEIVYREACYLAATSPFRIDLEFLQKGLHDLQRADMMTKIQDAVDAVGPDDGYEAIVLGYARCNDGLVGLTARSVPLVIPRAHDCITFFFGSRTEFQDYFNHSPGTYYMTTGWYERNAFLKGTYSQPAYGIQGVMGKLGLTESYDEMVEKYGRENAEFILESLGDWRKNYSKLLYLKMGVCDETPLIETSRRQAEEHGWAFEVRDGNLTLLRKLLHGKWDDDFLIVPPGKRIAARYDESVLGLDEEDAN